MFSALLSKMEFKELIMETGFHKRNMTQNAEEMKVSGFADLPFEILREIYSYLSVDDITRSGRACKRWYSASKDRKFWKHVDVQVKSTCEAVKLILRLPPHVRYFRICCRSLDVRFPLWLPDITAKLRERCPYLETLIFEKAFFQEKFSDVVITTENEDRLLHTPNYLSMDKEMTDEEQFHEHNEEIDRDLFAHFGDDNVGEIDRDLFAPEKLPRKLRVMSLRDSLFIPTHLACRLGVVIPQIQVLDMTPFLCITDDIVPFFSRLINLQELYLVGCAVTSSGIENLLKTTKNLKVLDLENTGVNAKTFLALKQYGQGLTQLYLGGTLVEDSYFVYENVDTFSNLKVLCLRNTCITPRGLIRLFDLYPGLKCVNVSMCNVKLIWLEERFEYMRGQLMFDHTEKFIPDCDHFKKNNPPR